MFFPFLVRAVYIVTDGKTNSISIQNLVKLLFAGNANSAFNNNVDERLSDFHKQQFSYKTIRSNTTYTYSTVYVIHTSI